jgi:hypothetical protein
MSVATMLSCSSGLLNCHCDQMPGGAAHSSRVSLLLAHVSLQGAASGSEMQRGERAQCSTIASLHIHILDIFVILSGSEMQRGERAQCSMIVSLYIPILYILYTFWIRNAPRWACTVLYDRVYIHILYVFVYFVYFLDQKCNEVRARTDLYSHFGYFSIFWTLSGNAM